ncbi:MAG: glycosyltransferase [Candidatus Dormibacteria bacterium]
MDPRHPAHGNFGQHNALLVGIRAARYRIIVTLDDDRQNPPEEIGRLLEQLTRTSTWCTDRRFPTSTVSGARQRHA